MGVGVGVGLEVSVGVDVGVAVGVGSVERNQSSIRFISSINFSHPYFTDFF